MEKEVKKDNLGRPFRDKEKGKMNRHNITMHDDIWESIVEKAAELNLSASQYMAINT
ncbi:hypothetical protein R4K55_05150 [Brachyspira alvinipulli]|uniref:hypothetical protein n=1 Tax=Brachyspira alvinipulli TaxID=84379 RepID=UPI0030060E9C